jgi:hypothetical protein
LTAEETVASQEALEPIVDRGTEEVGSKGIDGEALVAKAREAVKNQSN